MAANAHKLLNSTRTRQRYIWRGAERKLQRITFFYFTTSYEKLRVHSKSGALAKALRGWLIF